MPKLFKIRRPVEFPPDQEAFLEHCRRMCFEHAQNVARTVKEALRHGPKTLADSWMCIIAHDSIKVMLYYLTEVGEVESESGRQLMKETLPLFRGNIRALEVTTPMCSAAGHCVSLQTSVVFSYCLQGMLTIALQVSIRNWYAQECGN